MEFSALLLRNQVQFILMPLKLERKLQKEARKKFGTLRSPRAKSYVYGTLFKIEKRKKK